MYLLLMLGIRMSQRQAGYEMSQWLQNKSIRLFAKWKLKKYNREALFIKYNYERKRKIRMDIWYYGL